MTREEFIAEIRRIFSRECLSEDIHKCEYNGKCDEHEISKLVEVLEIYCKDIRADAIEEFIEKCNVKIQEQSIEREDDCPFLDIDEIQEIAEELKEQK